MFGNACQRLGALMHITVNISDACRERVGTRRDGCFRYLLSLAYHPWVRFLVSMDEWMQDVPLDGSLR